MERSRAESCIKLGVYVAVDVDVCVCGVAGK